MNDDEGNVITEFIGVVIGLMIPVMFIATSCWTIVETELAMRTASESMARAYVVAPSEKVAVQRSRSILKLVLSDHGIASSQVRTRITCSQSPCLTAGAAVTVSLTRKTTASIPGFGSRTVTQSQSHTATVDQVR